ncbi:MAG: hypothetical protein A2505_11095 [Deltaproteobacteria bacterium RIFOXYD12_FULL_55_16]|nr:MAG: hypothetical protein A2505_11095 [Deltaproteobacteria bacterium RIFOXYD12_FULL_55_16]
MNLKQFRQFANTVCEDVCALTGCSFQLWDVNGNHITDRHKPHKVCDWLCENKFILEKCQQDDVPAVQSVLETGKPHDYRCWANFTCFMVPIMVADTPVGAISVGEFLTEDNSELSREFWRSCRNLNVDYRQIKAEVSGPRIKLVCRSQVEALKKVTSFLAQVISDVISDQLTEANFDTYFDRIEAEIETLPDEDSRRLAHRIVRRLYRLLLERAQILAEHLQQMRLHHILTPLSELTYIAETITDLPEKCRALGLIRVCDARLRSCVTPDQTLSTLWLSSAGKKSVEVRPLLDSVVNSYKYRLNQDDDIISTETDKNLSLYIVPEHLRGIIENLIDNAIKASNPPRLIAINARQTGDEITLEVRDNGCGMDEIQIERIWAGSGSGANFTAIGRAGAGMGLQLVMQLAAKNWGELQIKSKPSGGSLISIVFTQMEVPDERNAVSDDN